MSDTPTNPIRRQWITAPTSQPDGPRTVASRLPVVLNLKDYGAIGDGRTDDTAAYESCRNGALQSDRPVVVEDGGYLIHGRILSAGEVVELAMRPAR